MSHMKWALTGTGAGIITALIVFLLASGPLGAQSSSAQEQGQFRAEYVVLAGEETRQLLEQGLVPDAVVMRDAVSADELRGQVFASDADGVILDADSLQELPEHVLSTLFASGRVLVVFGVEKQDILRAADSAAAFPDAEAEFLPDVTLNPGPATGSFDEPFFTVAYRSRPGTGNIYGGETTREYDATLFASIVNDWALNARGIVPEGEPR